MKRTTSHLSGGKVHFIALRPSMHQVEFEKQQMQFKPKNYFFTLTFSFCNFSNIFCAKFRSHELPIAFEDIAKIVIKSSSTLNIKNFAKNVKTSEIFDVLRLEKFEFENLPIKIKVDSWSRWQRNLKLRTMKEKGIVIFSTKWITFFSTNISLSMMLM